MDILKSLNQDFNAIKIEDSLFDVVKFNYTQTYQTESPLSYGMYREAGKPLGTVGKDFCASITKTDLRVPLECIRTNEQIDLSKLKYHENEGVQVTFEIPIGQVSFKNMIGKRGHLKSVSIFKQDLMVILRHCKHA
jgi:hypothetical protein